MQRGDLAAVIIGLSLVIVLTVITSPPVSPPGQAPATIPTTPPPSLLVTPVPPETTESPPPETPAPPALAAKRIGYTENYFSLPVRFLPSNMAIYGSSDAPWPYDSGQTFAYVEESHGGITETFTVPYSLWRMNATLYATRSPEKANFRMVLVDEESGRILEGVEIRFPGTVSKTVAAHGRPLYMVIDAQNADRFVITLEVPSVYVQGTAGGS
jgi:hypothetical protein